jgi:uncharacterized protein (TIGR00255 family)
MTGHGRGVYERGGRRATVEIRAVNHRFFDLKLRSGGGDPALEDKIAQALRQRAERGSFTVSVRDEGTGAAASARVDVALARGLFAAYEELAQGLGLAERPTLALIAAQPGVVQVGESGGDHDVVMKAVDIAADALVVMRRREGDTLARDLGERLERLVGFAEQVGALAKQAPEEQRRRLGERIARLLAAASHAPGGGAATLDEARLAQEIALLADKQDVTEELVRLRSHIEQVRMLVAHDGPVGRRLDFLVQELGREINTIGSKSQSAEIARHVIEAKAELEKIREQVQNVE